MSITLVWRTDTHLSEHTPQSRIDNWTETVLRKLSAVGTIAKRVGAQAVLDGGDFFHLKSPDRTSHALIQRVIEVHRDYPCPVYATVGNHDCVYGDYSYLPQQPLGVLYEAGTFRRLYDEYDAVFTAPGRNKMHPPTTVRVVGIPYHGVHYDLDRFAKIKRGDEDYLVVVAHLLASPTHTTMFDGEDVIRYDMLDDYDVDMFCFGHWHKDQGFARTMLGKSIVNIGSLTRGALSQDNLDRVPSVAVLRFDVVAGMTMEQVPVPHAPSSEVFDLLKRDKENLQHSMIEEFVEHLSQTFTPSAQKSLSDVVRDLPNVPASVRERTIEYIEKAGGG